MAAPDPSDPSFQGQLVSSQENASEELVFKTLGFYPCTKYNLPLASKASGLKPSVCFKTCSSFCAENYENIEKVLASFNVLYDKVKQVTPKLYTLCGCSFFTPLNTYIRCLSSVTGIRMSEKIKRRITRFYNREAYLETGQQQLRKPICLRQIKAN